MSEPADGEQMYFLLSAIKDMQGTIRAIDTKVSILLAALAIPIQQLATFFPYWRANGFSGSAQHVCMVAAVCAYLVAVYVAVRTLVAIGDATGRVRGVRLENSFYAGGMFALSLRDAFVNHPGVQSTRSVQEYVAGLPRTHDAMIEELAIESMALAYIRDLKLYRQRIAFSATMLAGALGLVGLIV